MQDKNYYNKIKNKLIDDEVYSKVKDYLKERHRVLTYYEVGKILSEAGKHYGEGIIKEYSIKLSDDLGKKYSYRTLNYMVKFYNLQKMQSLTANLSWGHWIELLSINEDKTIGIIICKKNNKFIMEYCSDKRILSKEYQMI